MKVKVKILNGKYADKIGVAEYSNVEENAMVYPIDGNPYRVCVPWRDLEVLDNE